MNLPEYLIGNQAVEIQIMVRMKDGPAGRQRGDLIAVEPVPNKRWSEGRSREETLPNYLIIEVNDTDKEGFKEYEGRHLHVNPLDEKSASKRSKYRLNLDNLPQNYAAKRPHLTLNKIAVTTNAILKSYAIWPRR